MVAVHDFECVVATTDPEVVTAATKESVTYVLFLALYWEWYIA